MRIATVIGPAQGECPPPLHDVQIVGTHGSLWSLAGIERIHGQTTEELFYGQTWLLTPAEDLDYLRLQREWTRMVVLLRENGIDPEIEPRCLRD